MQRFRNISSPNRPTHPIDQPKRNIHDIGGARLRKSERMRQGAIL